MRERHHIGSWKGDNALRISDSMLNELGWSKGTQVILKSDDDSVTINQASLVDASMTMVERLMNENEREIHRRKDWSNE